MVPPRFPHFSIYNCGLLLVNSTWTTNCKISLGSLAYGSHERLKDLCLAPWHPCLLPIFWRAQTFPVAKFFLLWFDPIPDHTKVYQTYWKDPDHSLSTTSGRICKALLFAYLLPWSHCALPRRQLRLSVAGTWPLPLLTRGWNCGGYFLQLHFIFGVFQLINNFPHFHS